MAHRGALALEVEEVAAPDVEVAPDLNPNPGPTAHATNTEGCSGPARTLPPDLGFRAPCRKVTGRTGRGGEG